MNHRRSLQATLSLLFVAAGCTATVTNGPSDGGGGLSGTCAQEPTIMCTGGASGYLCTGTITPDLSIDINLNCSAGTPYNAGNTQYCCTGGPSTGGAADGGICTPQTIASCTGGSMGYSCTGTNTPATAAPGLNCGAGVSDDAGTTTYCCAVSAAMLEAGTCGLAPTGAATCMGAATAYACNGAVTPSTAMPSLSCGTGTPWMGETLFCCQAGAEAGPTEGGAACSVGVTTGSAACDTCIDGACCAALTTCDTPDDAGTTMGGLSQCEALVQCILDCQQGNPDAGVKPENLSMCQGLCNPSYSASEQTNANSVIMCEMGACATQCQ